jgi:hypothetical protein
MRILKLPLFLFLALACGCTGGKVTLSPSFEKSPPRTIALLPANLKGEVARERVEMLENLTARELKNRGYILLDDQLVAKVCPASPCAADKLFKNYAIDAVAALDIESASQNNFLAGYYNTIAGTLKLTAKDGSSLGEISHSERESGGLLLQSGQVFQGVIDQIGHSGDDGFTLLAERFARSISSKLPEAKSGADVNLTASSLVINDVSATPVKLPIYKVCASSVPGLQANIIAGRARSTLREVGPGRYCGAFRADSLTNYSNQVAVEVRSPFGDIAKRQVAALSFSPCENAASGSVVKVGGGNKVLVTCATQASPANAAQCTNDSECMIQRIAVYRSASEIGPFEKLGETNGKEWIDKKPSSPSVYSVLSFSKFGTSSLPILLSPGVE